MPKGKLGRGKVSEGWWSSSCKSPEPHRKVGSQWTQNNQRWSVFCGNWASSGELRALCRLFVPMTRIRVLAVMLVTTLVATHSHSPWSSLLRDRNCKLPLGRMLCLLLLGFPTFNGHGNYSNMVNKWWPKKKLLQHITGRRWFITYLLWCVFVYCTFLQVMVGISGSPEAAQGITSSLPASWRYSPPGLTLK